MLLGCCTCAFCLAFGIFQYKKKKKKKKKKISILACKIEAHLASFIERDEDVYEFVLEVPGTITVMAEVLMWTLGVKINWILAP